MVLALSYVVEKLAEAAARRASGLRYDIDALGLAGETKRMAEEVIESVAMTLVFERRGLLRCAVCSKGPFTRKGLYLHLTRVHREFIEELVRKELEARLLGKGGGSGGAEHAHRA
ncbi:hypothetical protein Pyrfu_1770 [Pyrolobus fumarii 1A]|uniref:Uncharacterized protein n=1 Tax=Pyrolobus fumarii (strain DSM 11204 / 1A) TaxID=694429 RepID=G0ECQ4_PYRF1|nr:hypothetical protein [Pyrolobus fumarii]AEM39624.1 hypothetical protein Pyrfu_1770 [Pyrolobus fumarii 1A]